MREGMASPNREPQKRPTDPESPLPVDNDLDAILQFESEPRDGDETADLASEEAAPSRVMPFPTVIHGAAASNEATAAPPGPAKALTPASAPEDSPASDIVAEAPTPRGWRNPVTALLIAVLLTQGAVMAYWMMARGRSASIIPSTGTVTITSEPAGSAVTIDGSVRGQTPLTLALNAGAHAIVIGTGAVSRSQNITVTAGGQSSLHVQLPAEVASSLPAAATTGTLQIATDPPGARVSVDGTARGTAPLTIANLSPGAHVVTVRADNGDPVRRSVTVHEGATASLIMTMPGTGPSAPGWLAISSEVALQVKEKGELLGTTDMSRILLPAGPHELELVNAALDYRITRTVIVAGGQTAAVSLVRPRGTISVNALPWAEVWIDGQRAGETPIGNYALPIGTHELVFRHPDLGEQHKTVTVGAQSPVRVGVDMKKP